MYTTFKQLSSQPILLSTDCISDVCAYADVAMNAIDMMVHEGDWDSENRLIFSRPMPFAPKAQKGIDKGKKSTRFLERCIVG